MIDLKAARADPDGYRAALARRGFADELGALLAADERRRSLLPRIEELRARRKLKGKPSPEQLEELARVKEELSQLEAELAGAEADQERLLAVIPNLPDPDAPDGLTDEDAVELRRVGEPRDFGFEPRDHLELAWIDMERGAKVSGSRFAYRVGDVALLELSLYRWALDRLVGKGFVPMLPPVLVREEPMYGTGFLPTDEANLYRLERDNLYLTGTSEVALAGLHMGEILDAEQLPLRYTAFSTNFRREAGAAGRDTRGMFRVHQFNKVELFAYTLPEYSWDEFERILGLEEANVQELGLPYRLVNIAAGDLSSAAAKRYDIEAWFPSQERYRELTSASNTTDFQARRLGIRYRPAEGRRPEVVHTLNGTAVAVGRTIIALLENGQREDGSVKLPDVLVPYGAPSELPAAPL